MIEEEGDGGVVQPTVAAKRTSSSSSSRRSRASSAAARRRVASASTGKQAPPPPPLPPSGVSVVAHTIGVSVDAMMIMRELAESRQETIRAKDQLIQILMTNSRLPAAVSGP